MVQETYSEEIQKILQNKKKLEAELNVKITNKGKLIFLKGRAENEFTAIQFIDAINLGFSIDRALLLKDENIILQTLNIKDLTKKHNLEEIRGRIIGTKGKTLKTLNTLTNCAISLKDNEIGIIGDTDNIEDAVQAVTSLVQGSKQGNVYSRLERHNKEKRLRQRGVE